MLRAIVLDFDGVIADTEPLHCRAFVAVAAGEGLGLTEAEYFSPTLLGLNDAALLRRLYELRGRPLDADQAAALLRKKDAAYLAMIAGGLPLLPGVDEFVERMRAQVPLAICSGAHRGEIEQILCRAGLLDAFETIVSADDVKTSKPDPSGYLEAVRRLSERAPRLRPAECLAAEDSVHGVSAAKAAGLRVVAVSDQAASPAARAADDRVARLTEMDESRIGRLFH